MDALEHGKTVLSAVFYGGGSLKALDYLRSRLEASHFADPVQQALFVLASRYADQAHGILPRKALDDLLRDAAPGRAQHLGEYYALLAASCPQPHQFRHSAAQLRELAAERATGEALAQGMEILRSGARDDDGNLLKGHRAAREHVLAAFAGAEQLHAGAEAPEGDVRTEQNEILARYAKAKQQRVEGSASGVAFGIPEFDRRLPAGAQPGSLIITLGWTSSGKTRFCVNWAWHASVMQGRDVVYFTTETLRPQVSAALLARHSRHEKFGLPRGLDSNAILGGTLSAAEEPALQAVLADFASGSYGRCWVVQTPRAATIGTVEARLAALSRQFRPAIVFMDYLQLLAPEHYRRDARQHEDLSGIVKEAKQVAATFADGAGVPVVSPWQVTREGRKNARSSGGYSLLDVSETKEAADSADMVLALLDPENDTSRGRAVPIEATMLKNRDGERNFTAKLTADFATCWFGSQVSTTEGLLAMGGSGG